VLLAQTVENHIAVASPKAVVDLKIGITQQSVNEHPGGLKIDLVLGGNRLSDQASTRLTTSRQPTNYSAQTLTKSLSILPKISVK
jgi:hypothetical protein